MVTPAEHLLAMKVMASRPASDADDMRTPIELLGSRRVLPSSTSCASTSLTIPHPLVNSTCSRTSSPTSNRALARSSRHPAWHHVRPGKRPRQNAETPNQ